MLGAGEGATHAIAPGRGVWSQGARGSVTVNGQALTEGDGLAIEDEAAVSLTGAADRSEVLLFDLA